MRIYPNIYICVGLPGVGKSTYVDKVSLEGIEVFSTDSLIEEIAEKEGKTYNQVFKDAIKVVEPIFWEGVMDALGREQSILIDRTNLSVRSRKRFLDMTPKGYFKVALNFFCNPETNLKRLEQRPGKAIPTFVLEDMRKRFERPSCDEGFDQIIDINTE